MPVYHEPVLLKESIDFLVTDVSGIYVDATFGGGGHTRELLSRLDAGAKVIAFDVDENSRLAAEEISSSDPRLSFADRNFSSLHETVSEKGIDSVSGVLMDLGVSSYQIDHEEGFSYRRDEKLDMRLDKRLQTSAYEVINTYTAAQLAGVFWRYGEEPRSRALARAIVKQREHGSIETTFQLGNTIGGVCGKTPKVLSRNFQALRIEVNRELDALTAGLDAAISTTSRGGRIVVISYHSLEDRIVKEKFRYEAATCVCPPRTIICTCGKVATVRVITRKPVSPGEEETQKNRRARSAKMRVAEKIL